MKFISIGYNNYVNLGKVLGIVSYYSAPVKRAVQEAKAKKLIIDGTNGRKTNSVIFLEDGYIALSASMPETLFKRINNEE